MLVNVAAGGIICKSIASGTCKTVGTATAASPLYPRPLTATAYLTGSLASPTLTLIFPAPFPLTLVGSVNLTTKAASFSGLPDIPLTSLSLTLNGGSFGLFATNCSPADGTVTASSTDQNGDESVSGSAGYAVSGCGAFTTPAASSGGKAATRPKLSALRLADLNSGHPALSFTLASGSAKTKLTRVSIAPPSGFGLIAKRVGRKLKVAGVKLTGAKVKSLSFSHGKLVITLRSGVKRFQVKVTKALTESSSLMAKARHKRLRSVRLSLSTRTAQGKNYNLTGLIKRL